MLCRNVVGKGEKHVGWKLEETAELRKDTE